MRTIFAKIWLANLKIVSPRHLSDIKNDKPATFLLLNFLYTKKISLLINVNYM